MTMQEQIEGYMKRLNAFSQKYLGLNEIEIIADCKQTKASEIMMDAKNKFNGLSRYHSTKVTRESVMKALNIDLEQELKILQQITEMLLREGRDYEIIKSGYQEF